MTEPLPTCPRCGEAKVGVKLGDTDQWTYGHDCIAQPLTQYELEVALDRFFDRLAMLLHEVTTRAL